MQSGESQAVNWKIFREDTEAGRLLRRLYGDVEQHATKDFAYPRHNVKRNTLFTTTLNRPKWNLSHHNRESSKVMKNKVSVPKVGKIVRNHQKCPNQTKLNAIPRRKTYASCAQTINDLKTYAMAYRPPNQALTTTEDEKIKLAEMFENSAEEKQVLDHREESKLKKTETISEGPSTSSMANQIYHEIKERHQFQKEMELIDDKYSKKRNAVTADIRNRIHELMRYDQALAKKLLEELQYK
jgi:hypothetical protein